MQYYILMIDYGRDGREAIVDPEATRRQIVSEARDVLARDDREIAFVHHIQDGICENVTAEIIAEARDSIEVEPVDRQAIAWDHARDLRKHEVV